MIIEKIISKKWVMICTSAVLYSLPFYFPQTCFWISFVYLIPLFYIGVRQKISWKEGYIWGLIALAGHESGVFYGMVGMAEGSYWARAIPILFLIFFRAVFPALWFWLTEESIYISQTKKISNKLIIWTLSAWLYHIWMDQCHLWIFGVCEGYILLNPLIPLAACPQLLWLLPLLGQFLLLYLIACSAQMAYAFLTKNVYVWLVVVGMLLMWALGFFIAREEGHPFWLSRVGVVQEKFSTTSEASALMFLRQTCDALRQRYPEVSCVICPETCIYESGLNDHIKIYARDVCLPYQLIGGFGFDADHRNTAYLIQNCDVYIFDKRHAMPLTERVPTWADVPVVSDLYFLKRPQIVPSRNFRPLWYVATQLAVPYICSELFFNNYPDDVYPAAMILALCNDDWAPPSVKYLMFLGAQYRARHWNRDILYVSYSYAALITSGGSVYPVQV